MEILILSNEEQDRNLFISCLSADKSLFTFCPSEAKRGEFSAALRRYQEAKPPLDTPRQAAGRIYFLFGCLINGQSPNCFFKNLNALLKIKNIIFFKTLQNIVHFIHLIIQLIYFLLQRPKFIFGHHLFIYIFKFFIYIFKFFIYTLKPACNHISKFVQSYSIVIFLIHIIILSNSNLFAMQSS